MKKSHLRHYSHRSKKLANTKFATSKSSTKKPTTHLTTPKSAKRLFTAALFCAVSMAGPNEAIAAPEIRLKDGFKVIDPCCPTYWIGINGRLEFDELVFAGTAFDKQGNFPNSGTIRRGFVSVNGGVGDCWTYNFNVDLSRTSQFINAVAGLNVLNPGEAAAFSTRAANLDFPSNTVIIEDAWVGYSGLFDCACLRFGQFTPLSTMDGAANYGQDNSAMFLESALATMAFDVPSYIQSSSRSLKGLGIILNTQFCDLFTFGATLYQPAAGHGNNYGNPRRADRLGAALRLTYAPIHDCDRALHFGFLGRYQSLNHTDPANNSLAPDLTPFGVGAIGNGAIINTLFFTPPEVLPRNYVGAPANLSNFTVPQVNGTLYNYDPCLVSTGAVRAKSYNHLVGELAGVWGPVTMQGEYHYANVQRLPFSINFQQKGNVAFHGWHAQAGYILTGESRGYHFATGTLGSIKPCCAYGAVEIVARYSYLNLTDKEVYGGAEHNTTLGLNWYVNDNVRFAFNYLYADIVPTGVVAGQQQRPNAPKRKLDIMAARIQVVF